MATADTAGRTPAFASGTLAFFDDPLAPAHIRLENPDLDVIVIRRDGLERLRMAEMLDGWREDVCGVYVLIGETNDGRRIHCEAVGVEELGDVRAGKSTALLRRAVEHIGPSGSARWASMMVAIRRTGVQLNSAQAGYLEGVLHDMLEAEPLLEKRGRTDRDTTLDAYHVDALAPLVRALRHVLWLVGVLEYPAVRREAT